MSIFFAKNFKYSEIACGCGCGKIKPIDPRLSFLLQSLREKINRPIYISRGGGLRCTEYNNKIGGYEYSPHLTGKAADISAKNMGIIALAKEARNIGFSRIGLYPYSHFIHVDILLPRPSRAWIRDNNGVYWFFTTLEDAISVI